MNALRSRFPTQRLLLRRFHCSFKPKEPLKIAFFGSDAFSIASLKKLVDASRTSPDLIGSIDVIAKHQKRTGRDLKVMTDVPIVEFALSENLSVLRAESKSEILSLIPNNYSMAIAVSYGKLIPQKFIESVPYSLNVHPSLLPKYSGASPLQFALLNHDETTGVTVQTLHPTEFDKGAIVDQTEEIRIEENETIETLTEKLSSKGADLLLKVLQEKSYKEPSFKSNQEYSYASKITPGMREVDWTQETAEHILRKFKTLGPLFTFKEIKVKKRRKPLVHEWRRVRIFEVNISNDLPGLSAGEFKLVNDVLHIQTSNGSITTNSLQLEFGEKTDATNFMKALEKISGDTNPIFTKNVSNKPTHLNVQK